MQAPRLHALAEFLAVARARSFTAAAAELGVTPSALSQAVRQLESRLGVPLLVRTTRSVGLTDAGRHLVERAGPGVVQALEALRTVGTRTGAVSGRLRLTLPSLALPFGLSALVATFVERHPAVEVELTVDDRLVDIVADGYDAGVRLEEFVERDMAHVRLTPPGRFVVAGAPAYLRAHAAPERPRDLLAHRCLCFRSPTTGALYAWELVRGRRVFRVPVRGPVVSNSSDALLALAVAGAGLAYVYEPAVEEALASGALERVLESYAAEVPGFFLYFPSRAAASPALRALLELVRERRPAS